MKSSPYRITWNNQSALSAARYNNVDVFEYITTTSSIGGEFDYYINESFILKHVIKVYQVHYYSRDSNLPACDVW